MLASSNVNISILAQNYEYFERESPNVNLRRNYLMLFDPMHNEVVKLDCSLGVSLVSRDEQDKLQGKLLTEHPNIPGARMTSKEDKGLLHLQKPQNHPANPNSKMPKPMRDNYFQDEIIEEAENNGLTQNPPQQRPSASITTINKAKEEPRIKAQQTDTTFERDPVYEKEKKQVLQMLE